MNKSIYFKNLDGLRFLCFLSVFFFHSFHTGIDSIKESSSYLFLTKAVFSNGNLGVNFFFVLSGFLITYLLIQEKKANKQIRLKDFWMRRVLRIWPLFYFCLLFGFVAFPIIKTMFGQVSEESANWGYYALFVNNFDVIKNGLPDASILGVLWSIAIEEQFYLVWPILLYIFPVNKYWIVFGAVILVSLIFRTFNVGYYNYEFHTLSCIGDMTIGSLGAWLVIEKDKFKSRVVNLKKIEIGLIYFAFILVFFLRVEIFQSNNALFIFERIIISILILFVILEQNYSINSFFKMSNFKTISKLGLITYGLYCLHFIGILITLKLTNMFNLNTELWQVVFLETGLALIISIIISKISFKYFEKPFLNLKKRYQTNIKS